MLDAPSVQVIDHENVDYELDFLPKILELIRDQAALHKESWTPIFPDDIEPDHLRESYEDTKWSFSQVCPPEEFITLFNMVHYSLFGYYF